MSRILAIDYGNKRCGLAVTDRLQICANGLPTQRTCDVVDFLKEYTEKEEVEAIIVGEPKNLSGEPSDSMKFINPFINTLRREFTNIRIETFDERFTSTIAHRELLAGGFKKKERQEKGRADEISAVLILTSYLNRRKN